MKRPTCCPGMLLVGMVFLAGCTRTLPIIEQPFACRIPAELLAEECAEPAALGEGATYAQIIAAAGEDRKNLQVCRVRNRTLVESVNECNRELERFREKVKQINDTAARM